MNIVNKKAYFSIIESFKIIPPTQCEGWYRMHALYHPERIIFLVNHLESPTIACFGHIKKMLGIKMILIEGECYADESSQNSGDIRDFYKQVKELGFQIVEVCSNATYDFNYETGLRQAGFLRPIGQFSLPNTKIIHLKEPLTVSNDWRKNLKRAKKHELFLESIEIPESNDSKSFIDIYSYMGKLKSLSIPFNVEQIKELCRTGDFKLFFVKKENRRIATTIIYQNNNVAVSYYAAANAEARDVSASYCMYVELLNYLKKNNVDFFDMGKLLPATDGVNNVFLFKNGIQGTHIQLNGEWSWYKKSIYRVGMYFVKKYLVRKREL